MLRFVAFEPVLKAKRLKSKVKNAHRAKRTDALARRMQRAVSVDLFNGINRFKKRIPKNELMKAWETGQYDSLEKHIPWEKMYDDMKEPIDGVQETMSGAAAVGLSHLPPPAKAMRIDMTNPRLRKYVNNRFTKVLKDIEAEHRAYIKKIVAQSFHKAMTPRDVADKIVGRIGLHERYQTALDNYTELQMKIHAKDGDFSGMQKNIVAYENRLLRARATTIARTETRMAANHGQREVWREAANQGYISKERAVRVWVVDGAPCEDCEPMDGQETTLDEPFDGPDGPVEPGEMHPNCECIEILELE